MHVCPHFPGASTRVGSLTSRSDGVSAWACALVMSLVMPSCAHAHMVVVVPGRLVVCARLPRNKQRLGEAAAAGGDMPPLACLQVRIQIQISPPL